MNEFKKISRRLLIAFGLVASATGAMAQSSATGTANATATVIRPITVASSTDLAFGNVVPGAAVGTLTLTAAASTVATPTGGVTQPGTQAGTVTAAVFDVGGEGSFTYSITLPVGAATITGPAAATMTVDTFTSTPVTTGTLSATGTQTLNVGGTDRKSVV